MRWKIGVLICVCFVGLDLPSVPFNLTIVERKKGKTLILRWNCAYAPHRPTAFVVEGRWAIGSARSSAAAAAASSDGDDAPDDGYMTAWGALAQTVNTNWVILRSIHRGRWYKFRVSAVVRQGTRGFSAATALFMLSSAPKAPSRPQKPRVLRVHSASAAHLAIDIGWSAPKRSDMPIEAYRVAWRLERPDDAPAAYGDSEADDEADDGAAPRLLDQRSLHEPPSDAEGAATVAQASSRFTLAPLRRDSVYIVSVSALSAYDGRQLVSKPALLRLDARRLAPADLLEPATAMRQTAANQAAASSSSIGSADSRLLERRLSSQSASLDDGRRDADAVADDDGDDGDYVLRNLTVQQPYFQNGLVKAKLAWRVESADGDSPNERQADAVSLAAKTRVRQRMYSVTWLPIACRSVDAAASLPTPITASTINTFFAIYELRYGCDYVVNVRLAGEPPRPRFASNSASLARPAARRPAAPPVTASAQFKVADCEHIQTVGLRKPSCYPPSSPETFPAASPDADLTPTLGALSPAAVQPASAAPQTPAASLAPEPALTPATGASAQPAGYVPRLLNIGYRVVARDAQSADRLYAVEFSWSLPSPLVRQRLSGYQISVVPRAGSGNDAAAAEDDPSSSGSMGAVVEREQAAFVVRRLRARVRYLFQIQAIGSSSDQPQMGAANSLEFVISDAPSASPATNEAAGGAALADKFAVANKQRHIEASPAGDDGANGAPARAAPTSLSLLLLVLAAGTWLAW